MRLLGSAGAQTELKYEGGRQKDQTRRVPALGQEGGDGFDCSTSCLGGGKGQMLGGSFCTCWTVRIQLPLIEHLVPPRTGTEPSNSPVGQGLGLRPFHILENREVK